MAAVSGIISSILESPVSSACAMLLTILFVAGLIDGSVVDKTALILAHTVGQNFYLWNLVSSGLLETNIVKLLFSLLCVGTAGRQIEFILGIESFAIFLNVVNLACGVVTSVALFSLYVITRFEIYLTLPTYGFGGIAGALAVALKRFTPRDTPIPSVPSLKCHHLPMLLFSLSLAAWTLGVTTFSHDFPFVTCGIYIGWCFHRFVHHNADGTIGDVTDDFAFVTLFPPAVRGYLSPLADFCYGVCVLLGFHKDRRLPVPSSEALNDLGASGLSDSVHAALGLPGASPKVVDPVTERRRAKAREQLDAKLAAMAAQEDTWEDDEEGAGGNAGS